jgi:hypothetical protein
MTPPSAARATKNRSRPTAFVRFFSATFLQSLGTSGFLKISIILNKFYSDSLKMVIISRLQNFIPLDFCLAPFL